MNLCLENIVMTAFPNKQWTTKVLRTTIYFDKKNLYSRDMTSREYLGDRLKERLRTCS